MSCASVAAPAWESGKPVGEGRRSNRQIPDELIEASLLSGGSYAAIETPEAQLGWAELSEFLGHHDPARIDVVPMPLDVRVYFLAEMRRQAPDFSFVAGRAGMVVARFSSRGQVVPNLKVDGMGHQQFLGNGVYEIRFAVVPGRRYHIDSGIPSYSRGLYSFVLHWQEY